MLHVEGTKRAASAATVPVELKAHRERLTAAGSQPVAAAQDGRNVLPAVCKAGDDAG
jgi:hypothetical protein